MLSLVYTSVARTPFSDGDLATLLMNSRATNRRHGLSGVLLYRDGRFVQVLEGPDDVVRRRYDLIAADPRHGEVALLLDETVDERRFGDWSMGYRATTDTLAGEIPGFAHLAGAELGGSLDRSALEPSVRALLEWCRGPVPAAG